MNIENDEFLKTNTNKSSAETGIIIGLGVCTTSFVLAHVAMEALLRNHLGLEHYPRWCFSVYISKVW